MTENNNPNEYTEELVKWLRDFAAANADTFEPEQVERLNESAEMLSLLQGAVDILDGILDCEDDVAALEDTIANDKIISEFDANKVIAALKDEADDNNSKFRTTDMS